MSNFLTSSIGRKFLMSITGLFLVMFIAVHLLVNLLLIFDDSGELFNNGAHFMATNPLVKIMEPLLGLGFMIHIIWSFFLEYQNWSARPVKFNQRKPAGSSSWASRNMLVLGSLVLVFLIIHIINFFWVMRFNPHTMGTVNIGGVEMEDAYTLVSDLFKGSLLYCIFYIIGGILLGFHLSHGFWSAFQTLGLSNKNWLKRLQFLSTVYAVIISVGFTVIPLYFLIKF
ncbi:MAG: succinate dehydrogenase cytochrome b556 [Prolixibacteraceae bacterium]|nr:MAG: succinate dehydrogenase cytochrome b556 [Prolixibacteraceae bacterium]